MSKENLLILWCDKQIRHHLGSENIKDLVRVDGSKQIKKFLESEGWDWTWEEMKKRSEWATSKMVVPHYLGLFYKDVKNKMWSIARKVKE